MRFSFFLDCKILNHYFIYVILNAILCNIVSFLISFYPKRLKFFKYKEFYVVTHCTSKTYSYITFPKILNLYIKYYTLLLSFLKVFYFPKIRFVLKTSYKSYFPFKIKRL